MAKLKGWFQIPRQHVAEGGFHKWSREELLTWLSLKAHENHETHEAWPGYSTIQKYTGLNRVQISRGLKALVNRGAIIIFKHGRGNGYYIKQ